MTQQTISGSKESFSALETLCIRSIDLTEFIEKTAPKTKDTPLPQLAQSLVNRLSFFCTPDENGNFGIIRGGSMRSFLFNNYVTDERFAGLFEKINPQLVGENPLAGQIVTKVFSLPKDIDIFLRVTANHQQFHQQNTLFLAIAEYFQNLNFTVSSNHKNKDELILTNGGYKIKVFRHQTGIINPQTLVKVDINDDNQTLLKLHFGLIPDEEERKEDPRFFDDNADIDQEAVGYLSKIDNSILIKYFGFGELTHAELYLMKNFFLPLWQPFQIDQSKNPDQVINEQLRKINFRVALISWLFNIQGVDGIDADLQQTPFYKLFIKYGMQFERTPFAESEISVMKVWFEKNQQNLQDHFKLTASDIIYGLTVNPFLFFLFAFSTHILDAFPLGQMLEFNKLRHFLESLAEEVGGSLSDSLLTLSIKYFNHLKTAEKTAIFSLLRFLNMPPTISEYLKLIAI